MVDRVKHDAAATERRLLLLAVHARDPCRTSREELRRKVAERRNDARLDQLELPPEVRLAGLDLLGHGIAITRRAAFDDVRHVDVRAGQPDSGQELVEQLACRSDERHALLVLVEAGSFPDEHQVGARIARSEYDLRAASRQRAAGTARYLVA